MLHFVLELKSLGHAEEVKTQFTQAGNPSSFSIEDFAMSLGEDGLREKLLGITPIAKKTEQIRKIEEKNNMPIEIAIFSLYWIDTKTLKEIANRFGTSRYFISCYMNNAGIPKRNKSLAAKVPYEDPDRRKEIIAKIHTPESDRKKMDAIRKLFDDPNRKKEIIAKIHTPESDRKRSISRRELYKKNPELARKRILAAREGKKRIAEKRNNEVREKLGEFPNLTLIRLHYIEGYSIAQISEKTGLEERRIVSLIKKYGINNLDEPLKDSRDFVYFGQLIDIFYKRQAKLNTKQEYVIYRRYGLNPDEYSLPTLEEVGSELGVTREDIRQIGERAIKKLSRQLKNAKERAIEGNS